MRPISEITKSDMDKFHDAIFGLHQELELSHISVVYILANITAEVVTGIDRAYETMRKEKLQ
jgi:hypothetical protein